MVKVDFSALSTIGSDAAVAAAIKLAGGVTSQQEGEGVRVMDKDDQEKERGITITSKNLSLWHVTGAVSKTKPPQPTTSSSGSDTQQQPARTYKINLVDTPGHADFGGEVERALSMCDGVLLLVDAVSGPKPQTRFVLSKALSLGLKVIVVVNKIDRPERRVSEVLDAVFDLFVELGASDEQLDFPVMYTSALHSLSGDTPSSLVGGMVPLFDAIVTHVPPPEAAPAAPGMLQALVSNVEYDNFRGKLGVCRITSGTVTPGMMCKLVRPGRAAADCTSSGNGKAGRVTALFVFDKAGRTPSEKGVVGEVVMFGGFEKVEIGDTLVASENTYDGGDITATTATAATTTTTTSYPPPLAAVAVELPTVRMTFGVNKSPLAGKEGKYLTSRMIRDRLFKELDRNVALRVAETDTSDRYEVSGRGQLHLTVLIEKMRRE